MTQSLQPADPWQVTRRTQRVLRRTPMAWNVEVDDLEERDRTQETRFTDFIGFAALAFPGLDLHGFPVSELGAGVVTLLALTRPRSVATRMLVALWPLALVGWLLLTSIAHHYLDDRRLLHLALWGGLAFALASGRIHLPSAARGLSAGVTASLALSAMGLDHTGYTGRLAGFFGDPNSGGYTITVLGFCAVAILAAGRGRSALLLVIGVAVVLTLSRTTLLALAFSALWLIVGRRLGRWSGLGLIGAMVYATTHIPDQAKVFGPFSDRTGSDELRGRLISQEHADVRLNPWFGAGAGKAQVQLEGNTFYYHSSYLALQREGGMIALILLIGLVVVLALLLLGQPPIARNLLLECALISLMVCALNVGEVLLELPAAVALGIAAYQLRLHAPSHSDDRPSG